MARSPDERKEKARELFENGSMLIEIANQLNVPEGTVRSWKNRGKWKCNATQDTKCNVANKEKKKNVKSEPIAKEVKDVLENTDLTDKQRLFCLQYVKCFNATKAYKRVYECDDYSAMTNGSRLLSKDKIRDEIYRLKQEKMNQTFLEPGDIFQKYMDIAFADINDFMSISKYGATAKKDIDGSIVDTIAPTQFGLKIKLLDRMKALQWLTDHMDLATEKQKAEIALLKAKSQTDENGPTEDDGFIEALAGKVDDIWQE